MAEIRHPALRRAKFTIAVNEIKQLPEDTGMEVGFAGRSNAGKSSAVNLITGQKSLARTSKTPGRTQQIVYFNIDQQRDLVDLPGYGYAKVPPRVKAHWQKLMESYFQKRQSLKGLMLVMDIRHPMKEFDLMMLDWCENTQTPVHVLLTKADKISRGAAGAELQKIRKLLGEWEVDTEVQIFSSLKGTGLEVALEKLNEWLELEKA
jgi:GTP-binding protein